MGRNICPVTKSNQSNRVRPPKLRLPVAPSESEQNVPMMQQSTVTMSAPRLREMCSSSWKKAVLTSCSDISDVSAASVSSK